MEDEAGNQNGCNDNIAMPRPRIKESSIKSVEQKSTIYIDLGVGLDMNHATNICIHGIARAFCMEENPRLRSIPAYLEVLAGRLFPEQKQKFKEYMALIYADIAAAHISGVSDITLDLCKHIVCYSMGDDITQEDKAYLSSVTQSDYEEICHNVSNCTLDTSDGSPVLRHTLPAILLAWTGVVKKDDVLSVIHSLATYGKNKHIGVLCCNFTGPRLVPSIIPNVSDYRAVMDKIFLFTAWALEAVFVLARKYKDMVKRGELDGLHDACARVMEEPEWYTGYLDDAGFTNVEECKDAVGRLFKRYIIPPDKTHACFLSRLKRISEEEAYHTEISETIDLTLKVLPYGVIYVSADGVRDFEIKKKERLLHIAHTYAAMFGDENWDYELEVPMGDGVVYRVKNPVATIFQKPTPKEVVWIKRVQRGVYKMKIKL
nr:MAG TPA: Protein of unknown function (DUF2806) [Caudoviricetes sp.]